MHEISAYCAFCVTKQQLALLGLTGLMFAADKWRSENDPTYACVRASCWWLH